MQKIPKQNFENTITDNLQKKIFIFSNKNIFLADIGKIKKETFKQYAQLEAIKIKRKLPQTISITIDEKKPVAVFILGEAKFFIDKKGIVFEQITDVPAGLPNLIIEEANQSFNLGEKVIDARYLEKIINAAAKLKIDLGIEQFVYKIVGSDKLIVETNEGWEFYLNLENDVNWQLTKLGVVLQEKIPPEKRRDLEYIELRFGNFAPYKYK